MCQLMIRRRRAAAADVDDDRRRRRPQRRRCGAVRGPAVVSLRQFSGQHHRVAGDALTVVGVHRGHTVAGAFQAGDRRAVDEPHAGIGRGGGQRVGQRPHPAARKEHARDGVHVGDHRVDRQSLPRRHTGIQRLEREDSPQPLVADVAIDHGVPFAESADRRQPRQLRIHQRQRGIEVPGDESVEFGAVQPGQPVAQLAVARRLLGVGELLDRGRHSIRVAVHIEAAAVGELCAVGRIHGSKSSRLERVSPTAAKVSSMMSGIVSTVGPVSSR